MLSPANSTMLHESYGNDKTTPSNVCSCTVNSPSPFILSMAPSLIYYLNTNNDYHVIKRKVKGPLSRLLLRRQMSFAYKISSNPLSTNHPPPPTWAFSVSSPFSHVGIWTPLIMTSYFDYFIVK